MSCSIIIVNWNTCVLLEHCLASIQNVSGNGTQRYDYDITVVDNASSDGSGQMVKARFPRVGLIENTVNVGFARANNQGIATAGRKYILLLNSDTIVQSSALDLMIGFMDANPNIGACGPQLLNGDGTLQHGCHPMLTPGREFWRLLFLDHVYRRSTYPLERWKKNNPHRVEVIKGACLMLRRMALEQVGLLDEGYFMYTEEVDLCHRLGLAGWELWYVPQAVVTHFGGASSSQMAEAMYVQLYRSKMRFYRKFGGDARARRAKAWFGLAYGVRWAAAAGLGLIRPAWRAQAALYRRLLAELPRM